MDEWTIQWPPLEPDAEAMTSPVRCTFCGTVYDLGHVTVTQRYADCSVFKTPCCGRQVDDRKWVSLPAYKELRRHR